MKHKKENVLNQDAFADYGDFVKAKKEAAAKAAAKEEKKNG